MALACGQPVFGPRRCCGSSRAILVGALLAALVAGAGCSFQRYTPAPLDRTAVPAATASATLGEPAADVPTDAATQGGRWTPARLGVLAARRSPAVAEARAGVLAARARARLAVQRANPQLSLTVEHHSEEQDFSDSNWSIGPGLSLMVLPPSRRRLAGERAALDVSLARVELLDAAWQARDTAIDAALQLQAQHEQAAHAARTAELRAQAVAAARALVAAGVAQAFEWQTLVLEENDARLAELALIVDEAAARASLAASLALPLAALGPLELDDPLPPALPDHAELQREMLERHPRVLRALTEYDQAERDLALAVAAQYPAVELTPGYFLDQGDSVWSLFGGVVVPLFASQDAAIASAAAARDSAREHFRAEQAALIAALQRAHADWRAASEVLAGAHGIAGEIRLNHARLEAARAEGVADSLSVARAALQVALAEREVAARAAREREARARLAATARAPALDPEFARFLLELDAATAAPEDNPP